MVTPPNSVQQLIQLAGYCHKSSHQLSGFPFTHTTKHIDVNVVLTFVGVVTGTQNRTWKTIKVLAR